MLLFFSGDTGSKFKLDGVEFIPLGGVSLLRRSKLGAASIGLYNQSIYREIRNWILKNDTAGTVYHIHGWSKILTPAIFAALRDVADRIILHGHDYFNGCPNGGLFNYVKQVDCDLIPFTTKCFHSNCDKKSHLHKLWRYSREALRRAFHGGGAAANRLLMIHPGQESNFLRGGWPPDKLFTVRNPIEALFDARVEVERNSGVVFIGRISFEKGADLAAQAAWNANIPITFVGEGDEEEVVRAFNPNAIFLGHQDRAGVMNALSNARLALMPSRWSEPFGMVALEAISSGVPVIISSQALIADEVLRAGCGLAVNVFDVAEFSISMSELYNNSRLLIKMSKKGFFGCEGMYSSYEVWIEKIIEHYNLCLKN